MYLGLKFYGWGKCMKRFLGEHYKGRKKKLRKIALELHTEIFIDFDVISGVYFKMIPLGRGEIEMHVKQNWP